MANEYRVTFTTVPMPVVRIYIGEDVGGNADPQVSVSMTPTQAVELATKLIAQANSAMHGWDGWPKEAPADG